MPADYSTTTEGQIKFVCPNCRTFNEFEIQKRETACVCGTEFELQLIEISGGGV